MALKEYEQRDPDNPPPPIRRRMQRVTLGLIDAYERTGRHAADDTRRAKEWAKVMERARDVGDLAPLLSHPNAELRLETIRRLSELPAAP